MYNSISAIHDLFQKRKPMYSSIDLRIAAFKVNDEWYNCRTVVLFSCESKNDTKRKLVETENFTIYSMSFNELSFFEEILKIHKTGKFCFDSNIIHFTDDSEDPNMSLKYDSWVNRNGERSKERLDLDWPVDLFTSEKRYNAIPNELNRIHGFSENQIRCHDPPFENIHETIMTLLNVERWDPCSPIESKILYVFPTYLKIQDCLFDDDNFKTIIKFHKSIDINDVRLSVIGKGPKIIRKQLGFNNVTLKENSIFTADVTTKIKNISDIQTYIFLENTKPFLPLDQKKVRNKRSKINQRVAVHDIFDIGSERLLINLQSEKMNESRKFEWSIASLLHLCGFQTEWLDTGGIGEAPDVIAFYPQEDVIVVGECTIGVPNENKIMKFRERVKQIKTVNKRTIPIIFSKAEQEMLENIPKLQDIAILNKKQIEELFYMATRGQSIKDIISYITSEWRYWGTDLDNLFY